MSDQDTSDLTLGQLLTRGINGASKVTQADSPNDPAVQRLLRGSLSDLTLCSALISRLGVLSPNETLEDINTRDLRCVLVDSLRGEMEVLVKTKGGVERIEWLERAKDHFRAYVELADRYEIIPEDKRSAFAGPQHATQNPSVRREHKIAQYKIEKETKNKLEELRKRRQERRPKTQASNSTATTLSAPEEDMDDLAYDSDSEDDHSRDLFLTLLQLHYLRAHAELSSMDQELELLQHGMKMSEIPSGRGDARGREEDREGEDESSWKVERLEGAKGPLLSPKGKVLRPFTIMPSNSSSPLNTRLRLQSEVFRSSHRLPTMTIDEFLDAEREAGNILQGGGPNSSDAVDEARRQEKGEKEEDNVRGWEAEEKELKKTREWDEYRDTHRKGEGNMHNRG